MKELKAVIQPFMLTKVIAALRDIEGLPGITVSEVRGFGKQQAFDDCGETVENYVEFTPKAKLEIVVADHLAERVAGVIQQHAHTGNPGDGKIFVYEVEEVVKIRSGKNGEAAI